MALNLAEVFCLPPESFLDLQKEYDLARAKIVARPDPGRSTRAALFGDLPASEMVKRGWLRVEDVRNVSSVEAEMVRFFGVQSINDIEVLPHAAKKTDVSMEATPAQIAWLYRVKHIASEMLVAKYSKSTVVGAIEKLRSLLLSPEGVRKVPRILMEAGVRFVVVEALPGSKIDGACLWLDEHSPVIGLSLRHDRIDNFWFVLRHELEHVLQQHGRSSVMLDAELEGERAGTSDSIPAEERVANGAAAEFCAPPEDIKRFIARKAPFFAERDVLGFAKTIGVHPGLVVGQLQYQTKRYDLLRNHLVKIRSSILPNAMVDGWGSIAPVGDV